MGIRMVKCVHPVMSKRKLRNLVENNLVSGWDDPRMPTLCGLRRRGYTANSIRTFHDRNGVSKVNAVVDYAFLEFCLREELNSTALRVMGVVHPVKLVIDNYPEGLSEEFTVENNPERPEDGVRTVTFSRELWIDQDDFMEIPEKKYFRLFPGNEVRLMNAYFVKCEDYVTDENGKVTEIHCTYDPETRSGSGFTGRKVKGTIHWVPCASAIPCEVRLYENIVDEEKGVYNEDGSINVNPNSLTVLNSFVEPALADAKPGSRYQFKRNGFFCVDTKDTTEDKLVFNRIVSLKSSYKPAK